MTIADALDNAPLSRPHWRVVVIVGLGLFFDLFDVFLAGTLSTVLTASFGIDRTMLPVLLGSGFLGMFCGAMGMGVVADRIGRRPAFLLNLFAYSAFTLAGAFSPNALVLVITRLLAGVGIGAEMPLADAYLSEVLPARVRGRLIAVAYTIGFCGVPAIGLAARALVPTAFFGIEGWRWLFVAGSLGALVVGALRRDLVESPRWLVSAGRNAEAAMAAARLTGVRPEIAIVSPAAIPPAPASIRALFAPAIRRRTLMLFVFQIFQTVGYYGFGTMVPLVLASKGFSTMASLTYTTIAFLGYPLGSALSLAAIERIERRRLIMLSAFAMAAFGVALGHASSAARIATCGVAYTLASNVFSNAFHVLQGEIFPTAIRGRAAGSAYGLSRLSSAAMPFVLLPVLARYGAGVMFAVVAGAMAVVIADIGLFAPTTTGRSLESITP